MADLSDRQWRVIDEERNRGALHMAIEEVGATTASTEDLSTVRIFSWEPSTLTLGYHQYPSTIDWAFCESNNIDVIRRQTGGGGIYHDAYADISYSIIAPATALPGDLLECYHLLCQPILEALDRMGIDAAFSETEHPSIYEPSCYLRSIHPAHDIIVDSRKISGNAQYRTRESVIQHGSISFDLAPQKHLGVFSDKGLTESDYRKRVTSIVDETDIVREEAAEIITTTLREWVDAEFGSWSDTERERAEGLAENKYQDEGWTLEREDPT